MKTAWNAVNAVMILGLMAGAWMMAADVAGAETIAFETIERSPAGIWLQPFVMMATSPAEWVQGMHDVAVTNELLLITDIPAPQVNWNQYAVVVVGGGQATSVRVRDVIRDGNTAVLDVLKRTPLEMYNFKEVAPYHIVKIDRDAITSVEVQYTTETEVSAEDFYADFFDNMSQRPVGIAAKTAR